MENEGNKIIVNRYVIDEKGQAHSEGQQEVDIEEGKPLEGGRASEIPENTNSGVEGEGRSNYASYGDMDSSDVSDKP